MGTFGDILADNQKDGHGNGGGSFASAMVGLGNVVSGTLPSYRVTRRDSFGEFETDVRHNPSTRVPILSGLDGASFGNFSVQGNGQSWWGRGAR